jgi:glycerol-3-phosphate acyltransferase PlsY
VTPQLVGGVLAGAYLLGSVPFSYLVARLRGVDVRAVGSGNVGATNVMRSAGRVAGATAFVLDLVKGTAACLVGERLDPGGWLAALAALVAVLGHIFPVWLRFRGGKGVATGLGALAPLVPLASGAAVAAFFLTLASTRFVSLSSIVGALVLVVLAPLLGASAATTASVTAVALVVILKHHANIVRIARGSEPRVGRARRAGEGQ